VSESLGLTGGHSVPDARQRILQAAYELFARRGIRDVGIDEVVARAGVAKATLYRHYRSKDELVLAFLELRDEAWTHEWFLAEARRRGSTAEEQLFAVFDVLDDWFRSQDYESCPFINTLLEMGYAHPLGAASARHLENIRLALRDLAEDAHIRDADAFAHSLQLLMKGAVVAAAGGDVDAARRARSLAVLLLDHHGRKEDA
jgi:AcrR family transcriptional regulator